ncbi:Antitoxin CptB [Coxiella endosymbiont of Amblyomma nuttalli]|nr:Antitoxin CptB [Coxiella endosymbiont of Amblyomma nuttalli]
MIDSGKIRWKCRRGMVELDIILENFYEHNFQTLTEDEKNLFDKLLDESDLSLYDWFFGHDVPHDWQLKIIVGKILPKKKLLE